MKTYCTLFLLAITLGCSTVLAELSNGQCPEFSNIDEFSIPPYLGRWYEIERFSASFERFETCVTADYGPISETQISVTNSAITAAGDLDTIVGTATATNVTGRLYVQFPGSPPGQYNVLATDYEQFSCVYSCGNVGDNLKDEFAWILSRTPTLSNETLTVALNAFAQWNVEIERFSPTYQGEDCIYTPEPTVSPMEE